MRRSGSIGFLRPHLIHVDEDVVIVIDALKHFVIFTDRDHIGVDALFLIVAVKGELGIGDQGVEEKMLHNAVIGDQLGSGRRSRWRR